MNIFVLDYHPVAAAKQQCDKHIVKMILESAQMLSTAHRILDGAKTKIASKSGKRIVDGWLLSDNMDSIIYKAVHTKHPCTIWTMESVANYMWHYEHFVALCEEYTYRYGKVHGTDTKLRDILKTPPMNIPQKGLTPFKLAMGVAPQCINHKDPVGSYRAFYQTKQERFKMTWTKRQVPTWFKVAA
jgi:hypothetical protein